jgi:hypothetical protein
LLHRIKQLNGKKDICEWFLSWRETKILSSLIEQAIWFSPEQQQLWTRCWGEEQRAWCEVVE